MAAVTANADSILARAATYQFLIPKAPGACAGWYAPTTSTTLTLALGDAIAVALMGTWFAEDRFKNFPWRQISLQLATAQESAWRR